MNYYLFASSDYQRRIHNILHYLPKRTNRKTTEHVFIKVFDLMWANRYILKRILKA